MAKAKKPKPEDTPEVVHDAEEDAPVPAEAEDEAAEVVDAEEEVVAAEEEVVASAEETEPEAVAGDEEVQEAAEDAEAATEAADDAEVAEAEDEEEAQEAESEEAPPLRPKVTMLTLVLCVLTLLMALGTAAVVALDHGKRQEWSYAVFLHDLALMGLPLEGEAAGTSGSRESLPTVNIDPAAVKKVYQGRGGKGVSEPFQAVHEILAQRIRPEDLGPDTLTTIFQGSGPPVKTLEQEIDRVKKQLAGDIDAAAKEAGKNLNNDDARRQLAEKFLLPLARTSFQVDGLDKKLKAAKGVELNALLERGARLRMLAEVLGPLEEQRPLKSKTNLLDQLADFDNAKVVDEAEALLQKRIEAVVAKNHDPELFGEDWAGKQRNAQDKREAIAFLLYTVSQVKKPDGQLLYPQGPQRTEVVVGLNEFTRAAEDYALALDKLRNRVTERNEAALAYNFKDGDKQETLPAFEQRYPEEIKTIEDLRAAIKNREFRLKEYNAQLEQHKKQLMDRKKHYDIVLGQLLSARAETARQAADLRKLQEELFAAQRRLSDAAELNAAKAEQIRRLERQQKGRTQ